MKTELTCCFSSPVDGFNLDLRICYDASVCSPTDFFEPFMKYHHSEEFKTPILTPKWNLLNIKKRNGTILFYRTLNKIH